MERESGRADELPEDFAQTLAKMRAGDRQAINALLRKYQPYIEHIVRRTQKRRNDCLLTAQPGHSSLRQITMFEIARDIGDFKGDTPQELVRWMHQVALNNVRDAVRDRPGKGVKWIKSLERELHGEFATFLIDDDDPATEVERAEELERLRDEVLSLPPKHRDIISMRFSYEMSWAEIGQILAISDEAARKRCQRAIDLLRSKLVRAGLRAAPKPR